MNRVYRRVAVLGAVAAIAGLCAVGTPTAQAQTANPFAVTGKFCVKHSPLPGTRNTSVPGVKPDSIVWADGSTLSNTLAAAGASVIQFQEIVKAIVAEINSCGGINGRKIILKSANSISTAPDIVGMVTGNCLKVTEDYKAFAVVVNTNVDPFARCAAVQHKTIVNLTGPGSYNLDDQVASKGRIVSHYPPNDLFSAAFVNYALKRSMFKGKRVMVVASQRTASAAQELQKSYIEPLKSAGIDAYLELIPCISTSNCRSQVGAAVSRAKASGTDIVLATEQTHSSTMGSLWKAMFEQQLKVPIVGPFNNTVHSDGQLPGQVAEAGAAATRFVTDLGVTAYAVDDNSLVSAWRYGYKETPASKACIEVMNRRLKTEKIQFTEKYLVNSTWAAPAGYCRGIRAFARATWAAGNNVTTERVVANLAKEQLEPYFVGMPEFKKTALYSLADNKPTKMAAVKVHYPCPITTISTPAPCTLPLDRPVRARSF